MLLDPLPKVVIKASAVDAVCHGSKLYLSGIIKLDEDIRKNSLVNICTDRGRKCCYRKSK